MNRLSTTLLVASLLAAGGAWAADEGSTRQDTQPATPLDRGGNGTAGDGLEVPHDATPGGERPGGIDGAIDLPEDKRKSDNDMPSAPTVPSTPTLPQPKTP